MAKCPNGLNRFLLWALPQRTAALYLIGVRVFGWLLLIFSFKVSLLFSHHWPSQRLLSICCTLCRKWVCPLLYGVYQQVYEVRHRVWSHRGRDRDISASCTPPRATSADVEVVQSKDDDEQHQEKIEETEREKRDYEHQTESRSEGRSRLLPMSLVISWRVSDVTLRLRLNLCAIQIL